MNAEDFRAATESMEDVALWDVRRVALLAARRDDATPVRYFEEAVSESLRALHRLSQESLWEELQKHELGKRTLRALAAEYKPARMVAFEPDDLRRASVRFWEALRSEDELVREALAAYDYGAASGLLARLSGVLDREVVQRLVYINCPRQNVVEEVVGTITRCTTNELKMLASKLYDRLDKTGTLTPENREFTKKLPYCKTKEELRMAVRDLLRMFKRKPPPDEANPSSHIIGPSVATVTVSYKGQNRHVAAVVRIERMDDIAPEQPQMEAPPPLWPEPTVAPMVRAGSGHGSGSEGSVVTVNSDRTIPPSKRDSEQMLAMIGGSPYSVAAPSKAPSAKPTPPGSALGGGGAAAAAPAGSGLASPHPAASARPSPHVSVVGVAGPGSDVLSGKAAPSSKSATPPGSVLGGGAGSAKSGAAAAASELGSVRGSNVMPRASPPPPSVLSAAAAAAAPPAPGSAVGSTRAPSALHTPKATPPGSVLGSGATGLTRKTTPAGSVVGAVVDTAAAAVVAGLASDAGSTRTAGLTHKTTPAGSVLGGGGGAAAGPGSDVGSTRTGLTHKTTPAGSVVNVNGAAAAVAASGPGSFRSSKTTPAGSVLGGPAAAAAAAPGSDVGSTRSGPVTQKTTPTGSVRGSGYGGGGGAAAPAAGSVPGSVVGGAAGAAAGDRSSGAGSVKSMTSRNSTSSQSSLPASALNGRTAAGSGAASSQHGYGSISFDQPNLPVPTPKPLYTEVEEDQPGNDGGSERSSSPSSGTSSRSSRSSGPATEIKSPLLQSRQPSRTPSSVVADRKSLVPSRAASSVAADR